MVGPATLARFHPPSAIAFDSEGTSTSRQNNYRVRRVSKDGTISTFRESLSSSNAEQLRWNPGYQGLRGVAQRSSHSSADGTL